MTRSDAPQPDPGPRATTRLDKWLWQARFFRTRGAATQAVGAGRVRVNAVRAVKPAQQVGPGDTLTFVKAGRVRLIRIRDTAMRRGPATEARTLYDDLDPAPETAPPPLD